jgi:hypothetical protein
MLSEKIMIEIWEQFFKCINQPRCNPSVLGRETFLKRETFFFYIFN